jgi:AAA15 family ATPase/GTPase
MIQTLSIRNFKSVRSLDLDCRRVNVFIGEPNVGKTNILEGLGMFCAEVRTNLGSVVRSKLAANLFWDQDPENHIHLTLDRSRVTIKREGHLYAARPSDGGSDGFGAEWQGDLGGGAGHSRSWCKYYLFRENETLWSNSNEDLLPPFGENIASLLYSNKTARQSAGKFFAGSGLKLTVDFTSQKLTLVKEEDDVLVAFPYSTASETLRRMIFYSLALETNRDQVLVFDEPEAHSFPPYTKTLAERIALDDRGNQFFLTTHSPYMLDSLLSKTPASELNVVLCRMENFETKAYALNQEQIDQIKEWSMDAFFNFDRLLPEIE